MPDWTTASLSKPHRVRLREVGACALEAEVAEAGLSQPQRVRLRWAPGQPRNLRSRRSANRVVGNGGRRGCSPTDPGRYAVRS